MKKLRFKKIDAFTTPRSSGNPAAAIFLDSLSDLSESDMLRVARHLKGFVSEVGFVAPGSDVDFHLRYFSSEREVAFCGHATIAILHDLLAHDPALRAKPHLTIATRTDRLPVENRLPEEDAVYISAPPPRFPSPILPAPAAAAALHLPLSAIDPSRPLQIVNGGLDTLIVPIAGLDPLLGAAPDLHTLAAYCRAIHADIVLLASPQVSSPGARSRTRVFAPTFGYLEDPATGSGNAAFGYDLLRRGLWNGEPISLEQNASRDAPNLIRLFARPSPPSSPRVWFGGHATVQIDGLFFLP